MFRSALFLVLFSLATAFAADHDQKPAQARATIIDPDVRVLAWTPYDNDDFFHNSNKLIPKVFCTRNAAITDRYYKADSVAFVDPFAPFAKEEESEKWKTIGTSFEAQLDKELASLEKSEKPVLVLAFHGHGLEELVCRQFRRNFLMKNLVDVVFDHIDRFYKKTGKMPELGLFMEACHVGSIQKLIAERAKGDGPYSNGKDTFRYPIELYATSPANKVS
jgi:hypothetical protein